jgi:hypothetical protein
VIGNPVFWDLTLPTVYVVPDVSKECVVIIFRGFEVHTIPTH